MKQAPCASESPAFRRDGRYSAQRIAGMGLLTRSVSNELNRVSEADGGPGDERWERDQRDIRAAYLSTVDALENYVGAWRGPDERVGAVPAGTDNSPTFSEVVGYRLPKDVRYGADHLVSLTGADLRGANLSDAELVGADVAGADLTGAVLDDEQLDTTKGSQEAVGAERTRSEPPPDCMATYGSPQD